MSTFRKKVFDLIELAEESNTFSWYVDLFIVALILLSALAIMLESVPGIKESYAQLFYNFEIFSVIVFSLEYIFRIYSIVEAKKYRHPVWGRLKYASSPYALIDLLAVLPFYLSFIVADLRFIRVLRLLKLMRLLKIFRFLNATTIIDDVLREKRDELLITYILITKILFITSTIMYYCEHDVQPEKFSSIPQTMWWGVMTLTTVGYGDVYPITNIGKVVGAVITLLSISLFALPTGILASGFSSQLKNRNERNKI